MALSWDIGKCENHKGLWVDAGDKRRKLDARTESLVFLTMAVGLDAITEPNYREFFCRIRMLEKMSGAFFVGDADKDNFFTLEHIKRRIGLVTNATAKTQARFYKGLMDTLRYDVQHELRRQEKEMLDD